LRILLVKPCWPYPYTKGEDTYNRIWPPLCLANCASLLEKQGYDAAILDAHALRIPAEKIGGHIKGYDKVFVTSSSLDRWQCPNIDITPFLETLKCIKETKDEVYIMGYHGTVEPENILNLTKAKAVIRGEPERVVLDICKTEDLSNVKGLAFYKEGDIFFTAPSEPLNLEELPVPAFGMLDFSRYSYEILGKRLSLFEISRGCGFRCRFCNKVMYGDKMRFKSKEQVLSELSLAIEKYDVKTGYFMDLDFLSAKGLVDALCEHLIEKKYRFRWTCQTRPDRLDPQILKKMNLAGCKIIHLGVEAGLQSSLDYFNKDITLDKIEKGMEMCREAGIKTLVFFLVGLPRETEKDRLQALKFFKKIRPDFISFHRLFPYHGTDIHNDKLKADAGVEKFIRYGLLRYYLDPSYLSKLEPSVALRGLNLFCRRLRNLK